MIKKLFGTVLLLTLMTLSFASCDKKEPVSSSSPIISEGPLVISTETSASAAVSTETSVSMSISSEASTSEDNPEVNKGLDFQVNIINMCKADIGMVAILDPYEGNQHEIGELADGQVLTCSFTGWPEDVTSFDVAFYNNAGELVSNSTVDITGVKSMVTIMLSGEGNIEKVKSEIN
ncbi:MAG: hypothetical protein J6Z09_08605 [Lachnospiraceae bacterium]|nr:hypothetical protein [Lachnospiraceae bacterium]